MKDKKEIALMKADDKTTGGRIYTKTSIINAIKGIPPSKRVPLDTEDHDMLRRTEQYLYPGDFRIDEDSGILYITIDPKIVPRIYGKFLVPHLFINRQRLLKDRVTLLIEDFRIIEVFAGKDLCAFSSINSMVQ